MNAHDLIADAIAEKGGFDSVFWVCCGGSLIRPAARPPTLLKREATTFASEAYTPASSISCVPSAWAKSPLSSLAATPATPPR